MRGVRKREQKRRLCTMNECLCLEMKVYKQKSREKSSSLREKIERISLFISLLSAAEFSIEKNVSTHC